MRSKSTTEELARRSTLILAALARDPADVDSPLRWRRPIDIARDAGLSLAVTNAALKRLRAVGAVRRKSYEKKVLRGAVRKRYTSKPIVEYQAVCQASWPEFLLPHGHPPLAGARLVRGRCGCSG